MRPASLCLVSYSRALLNGDHSNLNQVLRAISLRRLSIFAAEVIIAGIANTQAVRELPLRILSYARMVS